jgi:prevent-host-death family protein
MPTPAAVSVAEARSGLADLLNRVAYGKERLVVTRHGRQLAAIVPIEDLDLLDRLRGFVMRKDVVRALRDLDSGRARPWQELRAELGL